MALTDKLKAIGDAIRAKTGKSDKLTLDEMASEVEALPDTSEMFAPETLLAVVQPSNTASAAEYQTRYRFLKTMLPLQTKINDNQFRSAFFFASSKYGYGSYPSKYIEALEYDRRTAEIVEKGFANITRVGDYGIYGISPEYCIDSDLYQESKKFSDTVVWNFPNVETCGDYAFTNTSISQISIPKLRSAEDNAFSSCCVKDFYAPALETVGSYAFDSCQCESVTLPSLKRADSIVFRVPKKLKKVDLGSVESFAASSQYSAMFYNYSRVDTLTALIIRSTKVPALSNKDGLCDKNWPIHPQYTGSAEGYIYVPKALIEDYKVATNWSVFADKFRAIEDYPDICKPYEEATE